MTEPAFRTLSCGAALATEPMPGVRSASITCLLPIGSATDPTGRSGLATVLSEMILRGAGDRDSRALADALDTRGVNRSSGAGAQTLRLGATFVGADFDEVTELLTDIVRRPRLAVDDLEAVRDLSLQDLLSLLDEPRDRALRAARMRHLTPPLNRPAEGDEEGLKAITHDDVLSHWDERARPASACIGVAGAIDSERVAAKLDELLEGWTGDVPPIEPAGSAVRGYAHEADETNQVQVVAMMDAPPEPSDDSALERLACAVLSGGMSGRLFTEVREKRGLCYAVSASYTADREFGVMTAYVGTTPDRAQQSLEVLLAEMERINTPTGAVSAEELARAREGLLGRPRALEELADRIRRVTLDELNGYLARRQPGALTIQTLGPSELTVPA